MTSLINPSNIDITFPIAGQDNDTQGFRTNYQNIRNNFVVAANEISTLQSVASGVFASNITVNGNVITGNITSPVGSGANITINPDGAGDVVFPAPTEVWVQSTAINAVTVLGGLSLGNVLQFANLTTTQINTIAPTKPGMTVYNFTTGNIQVYNGAKWANVTLS